MGKAKRERAARQLKSSLTSSGQALMPISGVLPKHASIFEGTDGKPSYVWARQDARRSLVSGYGPYWGAPGSEISRERAAIAAVTLEFLTSNSVIATLVENLATYAVGNGLTLSSRPDHRALGISPEAARDLSHQIENGWSAWATNPVECDASGRFSIHQLATAAFKSYLMTGEVVFLLDWTRSRGAATRTKVQLLDTRQLDQSISRVIDGGHIKEGVQFDAQGRLTGYWIRNFVLGNVSSAPQPVFVKALTSWGRSRAVHLFDLIGAGQIRGISPLAAALTPAQAKGSLREITITSALVQAMIAITVESDLSPEKAIKALESENPMQPQAPPSGVTPETWAEARHAYYQAVNINLDPGSITHLMRGDKLHMNRSQTPNPTYDPLDKSLAREAAKAAGSSVEDMTGDYSQTSFSASRLAMEGPWRINLRRRAAIVEPFYRAAFIAWLEEACETGVIQLPMGAPAFWVNPGAYSRCVWHGASKPVSDPLKAAMADVLELENGLSTYEIKLGERGLDAEEAFARQGLEKRIRESEGLPYPVPQNRDDLEPEDDSSSTPAK